MLRMPILSRHGERAASVMKAGILALLAMAFVLPQAQAAVEIDITRGNFKPVPIAISDFDADNPQALKIGTDVAAVIRADLERSGLFKPADPERISSRPRRCGCSRVSRTGA